MSTHVIHIPELDAELELNVNISLGRWGDDTEAYFDFGCLILNNKTRINDFKEACKITHELWDEFDLESFIEQEELNYDFTDDIESAKQGAADALYDQWKEERWES